MAEQKGNLRLRPVFAALIIVDLEVIALRIERWVDVAQVDALRRNLAAQDVEIVAVIEFVFHVHCDPDFVPLIAKQDMGKAHVVGRHRSTAGRSSLGEAAI